MKEGIVLFFTVYNMFTCMYQTQQVRNTKVLCIKRKHLLNYDKTFTAFLSSAGCRQKMAGYFPIQWVHKSSSRTSDNPLL